MAAAVPITGTAKPTSSPSAPAARRVPNGSMHDCGTPTLSAAAVMGFTVRGGKIVAIDALADPARLRQLDLAVFDD